MDKVKVLMIDDNVELINAVKEYFKSSKIIEIVDEAHDGLEGFEKIEKTICDVVILDLIMPKKDGLYVLEKMKQQNINKKVIVATSYNTQEVIREVSDYGVNYYILKPFDFTDLEKRILDLANKKKNSKNIDLHHNNIQISITKILHELGIPSHIKGYQYIRDGVGLIFDNPEMIGGITKELYPELASKFDTTVSRVERAIRHAIELGWTRGNQDKIDEIFGYTISALKAKPTNSEFIAMIADYISLNEDEQVGKNPQYKYKMSY